MVIIWEKKMLKEEMKKIVYRREFAVVFAIFCFASIIDFLLTCAKYYGVEMSWIRSAYKCNILDNEIGMITGMFFSMLFPILICTGVSDVFCEESKKGILNYIYVRTSRRKNIRTKAAAVVIVSFFMTFIPLMVNLFLAVITFPLQGYYCRNAAYLTLTVPEDGRVLAYLEMFYPYLNIFIYILLRSFIGTAFALVAFSLSLLQVCNQYVIKFSGMIYYLVYNCITGLPIFEDTFVSTGLYSINGYGNGWMFLVFFGISLSICFFAFKVGEKKERY
jgi:hypothetical protein